MLDARGLETTAANEAAVRTLDETLAHYLRFGLETGDWLKRTLAEDPEMALAHCLKGYFFMLFCVPRLAEKARGSLDAGRRAAAERGGTMIESPGPGSGGSGIAGSAGPGSSGSSEQAGARMTVSPIARASAVRAVDGTRVMDVADSIQGVAVTVRENEWAGENVTPDLGPGPVAQPARRVALRARWATGR